MPSELPAQTGVLSDMLADDALVIIARLAKNAIDADKVPLVLSDLVEADFPGYSPVPVGGWGMCESDDENQGEAVSDPVRFTAGTITTPQMITAVYLTVIYDGGTERLQEVVIFPFPVAIVRSGQYIEQQIRITSFDIPVDA